MLSVMYLQNFAMMCVPKEDQILCAKIMGILEIMCKIVNTVSKKHPEASMPENIIYCHTICRILVENIENLVLVDGEFCGLSTNKDGSYEVSTCAHSWLETKNGTILDAYPVDCASSSVLMIPRNISEQAKLTPYYGACKYVKCAPNPKYFNLDQINQDVEEFKKFMRKWVHIVDSQTDPS